MRRLAKFDLGGLVGRLCLPGACGPSLTPAHDTLGSGDRRCVNPRQSLAIGANADARLVVVLRQHAPAAWPRRWEVGSSAASNDHCARSGSRKSALPQVGFPPPASNRPSWMITAQRECSQNNRRHGAAFPVPKIAGSKLAEMGARGGSSPFLRQPIHHAALFHFSGVT